jgi:hypothetical protein
MIQDAKNRAVRIKVPPQVARVISREASRDLQLTAARGALPFDDEDLVLTLILLCSGTDREIRKEALRTLRALPCARLMPIVADGRFDPRLLDFIARVRLADAEILRAIIGHPLIAKATLVHIAGNATQGVLVVLTREYGKVFELPEVAAAVLANPNAVESLKAPLRLEQSNTTPAAVDREAEEISEEAADEEEINLSKYQQALEMGVSEKIKMALTGDKEWRSIFLKDANKLVSSGALKNPRITEGEVLAVAKNKSSSEELIRLINLHREWTKNYEIRKALLLHPRTPLPKALRYLNVLGEKDLKSVAKSRGISQVIVNAARRMLMMKQKKG